MPRVKLIKTKIRGVYWYKVAGRKRYAFRYRFKNQYGKEQEISEYDLDSAEKAERLLIEAKAKVMDGLEVLILNEKTKLSEWLERWYDYKLSSWENTTAATQKYHIDDFLIPYLGEYKLTDLTKITVQTNLVDKMRLDNLGRNTAKGTIVVLKASLNDAVEENIIEKVPFKNLDYSKFPEPKHVETLQVDELDYLLQIAESENITRKTIIFTLALIGARGGELLALSKSDIDFENREIRISKTRNYYKKNGGKPKTKNSYRVNNIPENLYNILEEYYSWYIQTMKDNGKEITDTSPFFITSVGNRINPQYIIRTFLSIREKYGLSDKYTAHTLRHTFVSYLLSHNIPIPTVAKMVGDKPATIMSTYAHSIAEQENNAISILNEITSNKTNHEVGIDDE
ncbi:hypothetical protein A0U40_17795 [[Bacillus] sp. KCTC 13219]|nr:hypothetical protein A0U40_17795 [[Bacillus] sp. KCTC 13219]